MTDQRRKRSENDAMLPIPSPAAAVKSAPPVPVPVRNSAPPDGPRAFEVEVNTVLVTARLTVQASSAGEAIDIVVESFRRGLTAREA